MKGYKKSVDEIIKLAIEFHALNRNNIILLKNIDNPKTVCTKLLELDPPIGPIKFDESTNVLSGQARELIKKVNKKWSEHSASRHVTHDSSLLSLSLVKAVVNQEEYPSNFDMNIETSTKNVVRSLMDGNVSSAEDAKKKLLRVLKKLPKEKHNNPASIIYKAAEGVADKNSTHDTLDISRLLTHFDEHVKDRGGDIAKILTTVEPKLRDISIADIENNLDKNLLWELLKSATVILVEITFEAVKTLLDGGKAQDLIDKYVSGNLFKDIPKLALKLLANLVTRVSKDVLVLILLDAYFIVATGFIAIIAPIVTLVAAAYAKSKGLPVKDTVKQALNTTQQFAEFIFNKLAEKSLSSIEGNAKRNHTAKQYTQLAKKVYMRRLDVWHRSAKSVLAACYEGITSPRASVNSLINRTSHQFSLYKSDHDQPKYYEDNDVLNHILVSKCMYDDSVEPTKEMKDIGWENFKSTFRPLDGSLKPYTVAQTMINYKQRKIIIGFRGTDFSNRNDLLSDLFLGKRSIADNILPEFVKKLISTFGNEDSIRENSDKFKQVILKEIDDNLKPEGLKKSLEYSQKKLAELKKELIEKGEDPNEYKVVFTGHSLGGGHAQYAYLDAKKEIPPSFPILGCNVFEAPNLSTTEHEKSPEINNILLKRTLVSQTNIESSVGTIKMLNNTHQDVDLMIYDCVIEEAIKGIKDKLPVEKREVLTQKIREVLRLGYHKSAPLLKTIRANLRNETPVFEKTLKLSRK
jgi:hypothetical protein